MERIIPRDRVTRRLLVAGLTIGLLACSGDGSGDEERSSDTTTTTTSTSAPEQPDNPAGCEAFSSDGSDWQPLPPNMNQELLAGMLDADPADLRMGSVRCDEPIATESFERGFTTPVEGISDRCALIGPQTNTPPQPGESYNVAFGVCVVETPAEPVVA